MTDEPQSADRVSLASTAPGPHPQPKHKVAWLRWVAYAAFAYVCWCATLYVYQDHMIFPADLAPPPLPRPVKGNIIPAWLPIEQAGKVESWFLPAPQATASHPAPTVVFFHGNAELIDYQDDIVAGYHRLAISVLLPEYRGYGNSAGKPSEKAIRDDCIRFYDGLIQRSDVDRSRIVFHGRSIGGGVACDLAMQRKPAAIILQSTFASLSQMAHRYAVPAFLVEHPFRSDEVVRAINVPLLIFHGTRDSIIPVSHGRQLHSRVPTATYIEYDCDHNDWPGRGNETASWEAIRQFLIRAGILTSQPG